MNSRKVLALAIGSLIAFAPLQQVGAQGMMGGQSQGGMDHGSMGQGASGKSGMMMGQPGEMTEGEIRKVDKDAGKVTIKHGAIPSMDMPPMTMVYRVKDPAMLGGVKAGDKVKFAAEKLGGAFTVTKIEAAR
jgi:Cu/Ag efflux protein CusF